MIYTVSKKSKKQEMPATGARLCSLEGQMWPQSTQHGSKKINGNANGANKTSKWRQSGSNKCTDETNGISGTLKEALQRQINAHDAEIRAREEANVHTGCLNEWQGRVLVSPMSVLNKD
jgi:hypothetical protein